MELRVLGPFEVHAGGRRCSPGPPKERTLLAALLVDAGRPVTVETLIDRIWGEAPPAAARGALYPHIARVRAALGRAAVPGLRPVSITRRCGGYVLDVEVGQVDLLTFQQLLDQAACIDQDSGERLGLLRQALDLWRGEPLGGVPGDWAHATREGLVQQRLRTLEALARGEIARGQASEVVQEVSDAVAAHPFNEPLVAVLITALACTGRAAEALAAYETARRRLAEELGTGPGAALCELYEGLLRGERLPGSPAGPAATAAGPGTRARVPAQLPADVHAFTGRQDEVAALDELLDAARRPTAVVIGAVSGTAGVGKTALAVHWAHRVLDRFPDGQLYLDLRGYGPDPPVSPTEGLGAVLAALGADGTRLPRHQPDREALYRTLIAGKRMLVLLDNASSVDQVRPLLPGSATCTVLVTSRASLPGLVARDGARRLTVDLLPAEDAAHLLRTLVGQRIADDPAVPELALRCARLPLALRVIAEHLVARPWIPLATVIEELSDEQRRLDVLQADGDSRTAVRAVLAWSYHRLAPDLARAFRLGGLHPGADVDSYAAAALIGCDLRTAEEQLEALAQAHLVHVSGAGRYGMHDLLRSYAAERAAEQDGAQARAARTRLLQHYLATAAAALDVTAPQERHRRPAPPVTSAPMPRFDTAESALGWLDANRPALVAATAAAASGGWPRPAIDLSALLWRYLDTGGHFADAIEVHGTALAVARRVGDRSGQARAHRYLGAALSRCGRYDEGLRELDRSRQVFGEIGDRHGLAEAQMTFGAVSLSVGRFDSTAQALQAALAGFEEVGDKAGMGIALDNLGGAHHGLGQYPQAIECCERALAAFEDVGDEVGVGRTLGNLGSVYERLGRYDEALDHYQRALETSNRIGSRLPVGNLLRGIGNVQLRRGQPVSALEYGRRALAAAREIGYREHEAAALDDLGTAYLTCGETKAATSHYLAALKVSRDIGDRSGEARSLNGLGEVKATTGNLDESVSYHCAALSVAQDLGDRFGEARAFDGLAAAVCAAGDQDQARIHWNASLRLFEELDVPEAELVRRRLRDLGLRGGRTASVPAALTSGARPPGVRRRPVAPAEYWVTDAARTSNSSSVRCGAWWVSTSRPTPQ